MNRSQSVPILMVVDIVGSAMSNECGSVRIEADEPAGQIGIYVDDKLCTAYQYGDPNVAKPVLFPINAPSGAPITRGYPIDPRPNDRLDHPHQVGHWFTHGNVNGVDFWNNSPTVPDERRDELGTIRHRDVTDVSHGEHSGTLGVHCEWLEPDDTVLADERTRFTVHARADARIIDRTTSLTARETPVTFSDDKEGLCGIRVARVLELPVEEELVFVDTAGEETVVAPTGEHEVTGRYHTRNGEADTDAWGTRTPWMALSGDLEGETITIGIFDHPANPGAPTYWMARPYGLFAANPFGPAAFEEDAEPLDFTIKAGETATFRYRIFVGSGDWSRAALAGEFERFIGDQ